MNYRTRKSLNTFANVLNTVADGAITCLEIVISDLAGNRPRRSHRIITRRVYRRYTPQPIHYHIHRSPIIYRKAA